jgi:hypothetical protein
MRLDDARPWMRYGSVQGGLEVFGGSVQNIKVAILIIKKT